MKKPYLAVRNRKLPCFMGGSAGPRMEICENSGLSIPMVPCLHYSNGHIKRKLRVWRVQKCNSLLGALTVLSSAGLQSTPLHGGQYRAKNRSLCKFRSTYRHGTAFPQKECSYQKEATGMESPKMYCSSQWKNPTYMCGSANYPISWGAVRGR